VKIRRAYVIAALTGTTLAVACTLNPQPLPPEASATPGGEVDGGLFAPDAAAVPSGPPDSPADDAGSVVNDGGDETPSDASMPDAMPDDDAGPTDDGGASDDGGLDDEDLD